MDVVAERAPENDWLEAALLAGYLPESQDIELAIKATHMHLLDEIERAKSEEHEADLWFVALIPHWYRSLTVLLEGLVIEMEQVRADVERQAATWVVEEEAAEHTHFTDAQRSAAQETYLREAQAAELRITRAIERMGMADADNRQSVDARSNSDDGQ